MRVVAATIVAATTATAGIGFLHTPWGRNLPIGRKLLGLMGMKCPIDMSTLTSVQVEASREMGVKALSGNRFAPARPTLPGLRFDVTSESQAMTWANARGVKCVTEKRGMHFIKCEIAANLSEDNIDHGIPIQTLTLAFGPADKLVAIDIFRRKLSSKEASEIMQTLSADLRRQLGVPTESKGGLSSRDFDGDAMRVSFVNYRFRDYLAMLTATKIPWSDGIIVHEQYSSVSQK